jgi:hypothetical protein
MWEFQLFGLFAVRKQYGCIKWAFGSVEIKFVPARWRYGKREEKKQRREVRRRFARLSPR